MGNSGDEFTDQLNWLSFAQVRFLCLFHLNIYLYTVKTSGNFINNSRIVMCSTFLIKITGCDRRVRRFSSKDFH